MKTTIEPNISTVRGDPQRLQQCVWNLLSNALKFTPKGGEVSVQLSSSASHVSLEVQDSGIGINPDFLPYVFDRLRQADSSATRSGGGLGLGLSIVYHLVELHGGTVTAQSAGPGQGSLLPIMLSLESKSADGPESTLADVRQTDDAAF